MSLVFVPLEMGLISNLGWKSLLSFSEEGLGTQLGLLTSQPAPFEIMSRGGWYSVTLRDPLNYFDSRCFTLNLCSQ